MSVGSPCLSSSMDGTATRGARSEKPENVLARPERRVTDSGGGGDDAMPVDDVGMGVGYFFFFWLWREGEPRAWRLAGRGKDEGDSGSNAGSSDGAGRLTPATGATGSVPLP